MNTVLFQFFGEKKYHGRVLDLQLCVWVSFYAMLWGTPAVRKLLGRPPLGGPPVDHEPARGELVPVTDRRPKYEPEGQHPTLGIGRGVSEALGESGGGKRCK